MEMSTELSSTDVPVAKARSGPTEAHLSTANNNGTMSSTSQSCAPAIPIPKPRRRVGPKLSNSNKKEPTSPQGNNSILPTSSLSKNGEEESGEGNKTQVKSRARPIHLHFPPPPPMIDGSEDHAEEHKHIPQGVYMNGGDTPIAERIHQLKVSSMRNPPDIPPAPMKTRKAPAPPRPPLPVAFQQPRLDSEAIPSPKNELVSRLGSPSTPMSPRSTEIQNAKLIIKEIRNNLLFKAKTESVERVENDDLEVTLQSAENESSNEKGMQSSSLDEGRDEEDDEFTRL